MAYNSKKIPVSADPLPVNSFYNSSSDAHEVVQGSSGAPRFRIADGDHVAAGARSDAESSGALSGDFSLVSLAKETVSLLRDM